MLIVFFSVLCSGFVQFTNAAEIGRKPALDDVFSAPPRNIFLKAIQPDFNEAHPKLKIVNGQVASRGQFCYQAFLKFSDGRYAWSCGGSLVTPQLILTAAHCVEGAKSATAVLGALDLSKVEPGRLIVDVPSSGLLYHEKYDSDTIYNDIGVLKLSQPVKLNEYICTVNLPSCSSKLRADSDNKSNYTVSGWGKTTDRTTTSIMRYVTVKGEPQSSCAFFYKFVANYYVIESQMCTSGAGMKSTCNGDSGGPLVQSDGSGNVVQQGIVSLGLSSCMLSAPSVFTDVRYFMDWLCPLL